MDTTKLSSQSLSRFIELGARIEASARGEPTEIVSTINSADTMQHGISDELAEEIKTKIFGVGPK